MKASSANMNGNLSYRYAVRCQVVLLSLSAALWLLLLSDLAGLTYAFVYVFRFPTRAIGAWLGWSYLVALPLIALLIGVGLPRLGQSPRRPRLITYLAGAFFICGVAFVGAVHWHEAHKWRAPTNPTTPRLLAPLVGLPVFPGAEGFGTHTVGGRRGRLIQVTSLGDEGPGTLRAALIDPNPRIIVFRVGGTIELKSNLFVNAPFVTIAGQTAPGDGIWLKNAGLVIATHDVLVQHLRIRPGNEGNEDPETNDAIQILGSSRDDAYNIVFDHLSASWGEDENVSIWYGAHDITISRCIISEALNRSRHPKRTHSAGLLVGDGAYHVSMHHNLLAHNSFRNPLIASGGTHDFVNNVVYNWGDIPSEIVDNDSNSFVNFVGNQYLAGPSCGPIQHGLVINSRGVPRIFLQGNLGPTRKQITSDEWEIVSLGWRGEPASAKYKAIARFATPNIATSSAEEALQDVLAQAGAVRPARDAVDRRVVEEVRTGTGSIINSPQQVGGFPHVQGGEPPLDSDSDGMIDTWETDAGLDPHQPEDGNQDRDGDGYTNVEEFLFSISDGQQVAR